MTILDAEYLEDTTFIDYNKPYFWKGKDRFLDNKKVIAEEWYLKPQFSPATVSRYDSDSGQFNNDLNYNSRSVIVIGTELQTYNKFCEMLNKYGWQQKDSWDVKLKPEYLEHYKKNNNSPIIINLK